MMKRLAMELMIRAAMIFGWSLAAGTAAAGAAEARPEVALHPPSADSFAIPQPDHVFRFPQDFGAHPEFRIEWWYVTGHLFVDDDSAPGGRASPPRRFGFQATFFRLAGPPAGPDFDPNFSRREIFLAHLALTDVKTGRFLHEERLNRAGWDAGSAVGKLAVTNGPWSLTMVDPNGGARSPNALEPPSAGEPEPPPSQKRVRGTRSTSGLDTAGSQFRLLGSVEADAALELELTAAKPLVVFGEHGVSRKGAEPAAASYYLTFSRLTTTGKVTLEGREYRVRGESWMDHEISSSQLGRNQVGWDWTCIQLKPTPAAPGPRELMLYRMRLRDGSADPVSRLQWVTPDGKAVSAPFTWEVLATWKSPQSGARYPSKVKLTSLDPDSHQPVTFLLEPLATDQELTNALGGGPYWEGACRVSDGKGREVGSAYLELTGYAKALKI
jgi:predicted secreted hydrolase